MANRGDNHEEKRIRCKLYASGGRAGLSLLGNSMLDLALSMYVLEHTGSASAYGALLAAAMLPGILLAPLGGVLADRVDRRQLMVWLDLLNGGVVLLCNGVAGVGAPFLISTRLGLSAD